MRNPFGALSLALAALFAVTLSGACTEADRARPEVPSLAANVASTEPTATRAPSEPARSVVLVAIDGVRYQEVFLGVDPELAERYQVPVEERLDAAHLVPNLHRLMTVEGAAVGAPGAGSPMESSGPNFVSLPGYMEMLTGRPDSGCTDNDCGRVPFPTIADDVAWNRLGTAAVIASWTGIGRAASAYASGAVVSVGRHDGVGRDAFASDPEVARRLHDAEAVQPFPGNGDYRPDRFTAELAVSYFERQRPGFLFVGLGDTDEYGHQSAYRAYLRALQDADRTIGALYDIVARRNDAGMPSTLFVTTDHGRADTFTSHGSEYPESSRVFLIAAGAGIRSRGIVPSEVPRKLSDVSQTIRAVVGLPLIVAPTPGHVLTELLSPT
jgi:hypothetical protein